MKRIILLMMLCYTTLSANSQSDNRGYLVNVGDTAPEFSIELLDGRTISIKELRGKVVMLQFTASWCGVCRKEMPFIESDIWQKHKANPNFALIGIDRDEPRDKMEMLVSKTGITYPLGFDPQGKIFELYAEKGAGITRNVIIGTDGKIVMQTRLYDEAEFEEMCSIIDKELSKLKK
ncbi:MAG: TlpA family protein disulfide reductase [Bacteroidales bacterium]